MTGNEMPNNSQDLMLQEVFELYYVEICKSLMTN